MTVVRNLSIKLNKRGVQTDVMTFNMNQKWNPRWQGKTVTIDGLTVYEVPAPNWHPYTNALAARVRIEEPSILT